MKTEVRDITVQRDRLRHSDTCTFVGSMEFADLLLSTRHLERCDVRPARLRGLLDTEDDHLFVIEIEKLAMQRAVVSV